MPNDGKQQTACVVFNIDGDKVLSIVIAERTKAPAIIWLPHTPAPQVVPIAARMQPDGIAALLMSAFKVAPGQIDNIVKLFAQEFPEHYQVAARLADQARGVIRHGIKTAQPMNQQPSLENGFESLQILAGW